MTTRVRALWIFSILVLSVLIDQGTKVLAAHYLRGRLPIVFYDNLARLDYVENPGAFLSLGGTLSPTARFWTLNVAVAIFLFFLLYSMLFTKSMARIQLIALSLVMGGGVSNLIDRTTRYNGQVVDFINMGIGSLRTGVFNVADMFIMAGIIIFALLSLKKPEPIQDSTV
jgi:signal peptidase II